MTFPLVFKVLLTIAAISALVAACVPLRMQALARWCIALFGASLMTIILAAVWLL